MVNETELLNLKRDDRPVLLAVLAHPDDETFGMGGTLAYYARRGVAVHLICATRGEVGEMDAQYLQGFQSAADRRESELRCAAGLLGLAGVHFLGYRDSGMPGSPDNSHPQALAAQPVDQVAGEVAQYIRALRPQVVITFDPIGGYRHPDHIAIHQATVKGFTMAGDSTQKWGDLPAYQPAKLYFQTISRGLLRLIVRVMRLIGKDPRKFGKNQDIDLASIAEVNFPTNAKINYRQVAQIRDQASACHASQGGSGLVGGVFGVIRRWFAANEMYMRAYPPPQDGVIEKDLFAGVVSLPSFHPNH